MIADNGILGLWRGTNATLIRYAYAYAGVSRSQFPCHERDALTRFHSPVRNVPGVAMYMTGLTQIRTFMASSPYFASVQKHPPGSSSPAHSHASVLPSLTSGGNLMAGAVTRVSVGFVLNPFSVLKARYEVRDIPRTHPFSPGLTWRLLSQSNMYAYKSLSGALASMVRGGPRELFRGFLSSALRDAPYAGLFVVFYEGIKREACEFET